MQRKKNPALYKVPFLKKIKKYLISAAKQKIRQINLKIRLLSDHIFTKNQTKSGPKLAILRLKSDWFPKHISDIRKIILYLKIFHI